MTTGSVAGGPLASAEWSVKLFVEDPSAVRLKELIPVFHRWIREGLVEDELLIDVASYEHVPKGPGIALICDKAHFYFDVRHGRPGLRYRARRESRGEGGQAVASAFAAVLRAASLLEEDPALGGRYRFRTDEVEVGVFDRLRAPSDRSTYEAVRPTLEAFAKGLYGVDEVRTELRSGPREPFLVSLETGVSPSASELGQRVAAAAG